MVTPKEFPYITLELRRQSRRNRRVRGGSIDFRLRLVDGLFNLPERERQAGTNVSEGLSELSLRS